MIGPLAAGASFVAEVTNFPAGIADQVGVKIIYVATMTEVTPRTTGAVEGAPGDYGVALTCPTLPGRYSVVADWAGGATPRPSQTAQEDLIVEAATVIGAGEGPPGSVTGRVTVPHFSMPFRFLAGAAVVVEQDSMEEITDCVANVCRYSPGDRPEKPDFGVLDPTFAENGPDAGLLAAQVSIWEPRAAVAAKTDGRSLEELVASVAVTVTDKGGSS